jgi:hypothetical protein
VPDPVLIAVLVAIEVVAAGFLVAESEVEGGRSVIGVLDTQSYPGAAALSGEILRGPDECGGDAVGSAFGWPDVQAAQFGAVGVALVDLGGGAPAPEDLACADR